MFYIKKIVTVAKRNSVGRALLPAPVHANSKKETSHITLTVNIALLAQPTQLITLDLMLPQQRSGHLPAHR